MADAGRAPDFSDLNPAFSSRLDQLRAELDRQGIKYHMLSGYRTPEYQAQMRANHDAKAANQPIPYPNVETPGVVAPAWRSFHNYGLATDFGVDNPADFARIRALAPQFGLSGIGPGDPGHIQLAGTLDQDIKQYNLAGWRPESRPAPAEGAIAFSGPPTGQPPPSLVARGTRGAMPSSASAGSPAAQHEAFIRDYASKIGLNPDLAVGIANAEGMRAWSKSNPNAASYVDRSGGQPFSFGDFQLNVHPGAMGSKALAAGVDPRDPNQWQAADKFALDQMKAGGIAPWSDPFARQWTASGKPITGGTTLTSTPPGIVDPSIVARGGTSPAIPDASAPASGTAVAATAPPQNAGDWLKKLITKPVTKDAQGNDVTGKSPLESLAGDVPTSQQNQPTVAALPVAQPVMDPMAQLAGPASQLFGTVSAAAAKPLSWSSTPYGSNAGQQMARGMTLNQSGYGYG